MHMKCLDCNYGCGTTHTLLFHYEVEHKDKVSESACGNQTISGNCVEEISSKLRGTASKWSSSNLQSICTDSSYSFSPSSSSIFSSSSNPNSDSNLRSSFTYSKSNSNSSSKSNSIPISIPSAIPDPNPKNSHSSHIGTKFDIKNKICNRRYKIINTI